MDDYEVQYWISDNELDKISFSDYWNDEEKEKSKEYYILDGDFSKMNNYLKDTGLIQQFNDSINLLRNKLNKNLHGVGADLACGNLWAEKYILNSGSVDKIYCVEYSHHRILKIGPVVLKNDKIPKNKVVLCVGSFYDLKLPDNSLDFIFLSQAFHHADRPVPLLKEMQRVLKPDGVIIIIGEHVIFNEVKLLLTHLAKYTLMRLLPSFIKKRVFKKPYEVKNFIPHSSDLVKSDPVTGDHYYFKSDYKQMFAGYNFKSYRILNKESKIQGFILINKD